MSKAKEEGTVVIQAKSNNDRSGMGREGGVKVADVTEIQICRPGNIITVNNGTHTLNL